MQAITANAGRNITGNSNIHSRMSPRATHDEHKAHSPQSVRCHVVTVSDTRTEATDSGGRAIIDLLQGGGHVVAGRTIVKDDADQIRGTIERLLAAPDVQVVVTTGGTGISSRDATYEVVRAMLQKRLDGFSGVFGVLHI